MCRKLRLPVLEVDEFLGGMSSKFQRKDEGEATIVLKAAADDKLWIQACPFEKPGRVDDVNEHDLLSIVAGILQGMLLPFFEYAEINPIRKRLYFLVDYIIPTLVHPYRHYSEGWHNKEMIICKGARGPANRGKTSLLGC